MKNKPFSKKERDDVLQQYNEAQDHYNSLMDLEKYDESNIPKIEAKRLSDLYFELLPKVIMSCCPFDDEPLIRTFDPFGLDGLWWDVDAFPEEPNPCEHFCVVRGAVNFNNIPAQSGRIEANPGPEVPYIIPRLLNIPGMIAVISQVSMDNGYIAYSVCYFCKERPPKEQLTEDWARSIQSHTTHVDPWDFDLLPWLKQGKIKWCPPNSDNTFLSAEPVEHCPYIDLPGKRHRIIVEDDTARSGGLPTGASLSPID